MPLRVLVSLLVAAGLLWALVAWGGVEPKEFMDTLRGITLAQWLTALSVHAGIYLLRAWRFSALMPSEVRPSFGRVLAASSAHNLAAYVLPLKSGEATFILYSSGVGEVPARASMASLLVSRLLDLVVLCACMFLVTWLAPFLDEGLNSSLLFAMGAVFLALGLVAAWVFVRRAGFVSMMVGFLRFLRIESTPVGTKAVLLIGRFSEALDEAGARGGMMRATCASVALWGSVITFYSVLLPAFGWPEGQTIVVPAALAAGFATLANLLPVNGFAGFGTQEGGWVLGMSLWGVDPELALAVGVSAHLVQLGNVVLFGALGHLGMALLPKMPDAES